MDFGDKIIDIPMIRIGFLMMYSDLEKRIVLHAKAQSETNVATHLESLEEIVNELNLLKTRLPSTTRLDSPPCTWA